MHPLAASLLLLMSSAFLTRAASPAEGLLQTSRPLVIAHRGYSLLAPENSLAAFRTALEAGVDLVELDYHHTGDGVPVVIHDGTLDRTTDAIARWGGKALPVAARTASEVTNLNVGLWFKPPFPGLSLPTLEAAMDVIQARGVTLIERKAGDAAALSQLLRRRGWMNRAVVQAFDWEFLRDFRRLEPDQVLGALGPPGSRAGRKLSDAEKALNREWLEEIRALGAQVAVWNRQVDAAAIRDAHALGLKVWIYTINEPALADSLLAAGVDGIITDTPAVVWRAMALRR